MKKLFDRAWIKILSIFIGRDIDMSYEDKEFNRKMEQGIDALNAIFNGSLRCPMCGGDDFEVADGFIRNGIQKELSSIVVGGRSIPTLPIVCKRCGFVSQHAIGVLGLLKKEPLE